MTKTFLITGASGGLGLATTIKAAQAGFRVYATMRDPAKADALNAGLEAAGVTAQVIPLDVQDQGSIDRAVAHIMADAGRIDVLVNNAGSGFVRTVEQAAEEDIDWVLDVNLRGVIRCTKAVLPAMRTARRGHVVAISSVGGLVGQPFNELYCAAKFGVEGFMESLATYVGPAFGIHFSLVEPGGILSDFASSAMARFTASGEMTEDDYTPLLQAYMAGIQARAGKGGTYQTAEQVAGVVMNCVASDAPPLRVRTSDWAETATATKTGSDPDGTLLRDALVAQNFGKLPL
jgi:NAD(P)-dependent dehydrogenase (short-subunit alcohol dehydrogenase family)